LKKRIFELYNESTNIYKTNLYERKSCLYEIISSIELFDCVRVDWQIQLFPIHPCENKCNYRQCPFHHIRAFIIWHQLPSIISLDCYDHFHHQFPFLEFSRAYLLIKCPFHFFFGIIVHDWPLLVFFHQWGWAGHV